MSKNAPPIFLLYPNQKELPVVGGSDPAPAHAAINGVMLAERLKEYGTEVIVNYPGHEDPSYTTVYDFLVPQLRSLLTRRAECLTLLTLAQLATRLIRETNDHVIVAK